MDEQVGRDVRPPAEAPGRRGVIQRDRKGRGGIGGKLFLLVVLLAAAGGIYWEYFRAPSGTARRPPALPPQAVRDAEIAQRDIAITQNALGAVTPLATVVVRAQISGQLQKIGFEEGKMVKTGDFLVQIDPRPYEVALEQAQATLAKDQALLDQAKSDFNRYQTLNRQDSIARQQVDNQGFLVRQYQATLLSDQAQIDSAKLNVAYCYITSPINGRIGLRQVDVGNYVTASDTNGIVTITQLEPISVTFTVPEDNVRPIMKRMNAGATLPATAFNRANTAKIATGTLQVIDNQVDATTGTVKLRAMFANADDLLFPQQFVNVQLLVDTLKGQVAAPNAAVQRGANGSFVYVVDKDDTVSARQVTTGPQDGDYVAITNGLAVGDHVVIDGIDRLRDGAKVVVRNNDAAPAAAPLPAAGAPTRRRDGGGGGRRRQQQQPSPQ